jgi:hypothetical protein
MSSNVFATALRVLWPLRFALVAVSYPATLGCSHDTVNAAQVAPSPASVEEIKTPEDAAAFLQRALLTVQRDSRALRESPTAKAAQGQADDLLRLAIDWLNKKVAIEPVKGASEKGSAPEPSLMGVWRHRLNSDGTENLMILGPEKTFVTLRGSAHGIQVWVGNWERRGEFLYTQNDRDSAEDFMQMNLPSIERITAKHDGMINLKSVTHEDSPGFTLSRIR